MIDIRPATPNDVPVILRFVHELAAFEREPDAVKATEPMLAAALFGAHPAAEAVIAESDGVAVGHAIFFHNFSTWEGKRGLYLEDLYVTPSARGGGIGRAMLRHLARLAVERDCARFEWSVLDWNEGAIALYRALGAKGLNGWTIQRLDGDALRRLALGG